MAYSMNGRLVEHASKITHMRLIQDKTINELLDAFEEVTPTSGELPKKSGTINLSNESNVIDRIVTIDGGQAVIPNQKNNWRKLSFIEVGACLLKISYLDKLKKEPLEHPNSYKTEIENTWNFSVLLPHSGVKLKNETLKNSIRKLIDIYLKQGEEGERLYDTLEYLVFRKWDDNWRYNNQLDMECWKCGKTISFDYERRDSIICGTCNETHNLTDYLKIGSNSAEDRNTDEVASQFRNVMEALLLFNIIIKFEDNPELGKTLFIKDGPLIMSSQLSRITDAIREYLRYLKENDKEFYIVGIEKNGFLAELANSYKLNLSLNEGDFVIPSTRYWLEEVKGIAIKPNYKNRVSYGTKVILKAGKEHYLALNIPILDFCDGHSDELDSRPKKEELIGFEKIATTLSKLLSYQYENALLPIVHANSIVSIARKPSSRVLDKFIEEKLREEN